MDEGCLVRTVVIDDEMHLEVHWYLSINPIQELAELGRAMSPMQFANPFAACNIERGKQRGGALAFVVVCAPLRLTGPHRQDRLRAIERLDLTLLIGTQHQSALRRVQIQADDVAHLLDQLRIGGQLEALRAMWLETECAPDA